ncbi:MULTISPECIES: helix-turn-helix domain-containing protein [Agrobacterium]|uniref:Helix-turn-helix transcriptional regulator n=1 Tax=Agrobacterium salinitolerans TaxID=1183413 RepID=A0A1S9EY85_9HYPH|nr:MULTISPECIES: helix-turn-helix transcriptional regulator [Agrobacterium]MBA4776864.1 helix-turn-helix transcriptional regulator [Hyphomicrobiales bacterium]PNQ24449.1 XRE family transcriptional regulator [Rhizobium sp. YIC5082]MCZ7858672.1 helix-turn-helix transcriptional regulator [Agrobacterium salinitolerans]MCZ7888877.1 helix-turn-helix transcriptional regulator [Agrobacterium salinitolerans]MCZ7894549.1 helix-turn-helix transcriptional regulator [Agrobacterium salinitolerans]
MARKEVESKTDLGRRLRAVRAAFDIDDRNVFASRLSISKSGLAHYERGERVPDAELLCAYHREFGVNISWLVTGQGDMFETGQSTNTEHGSHQLLVDLINPLGRLINKVYRDQQVRITDDQRFAELTRWHNNLTSRAGPSFEWNDLMSQLPWVEQSLAEELRSKRADAEGNKRSTG